MSIAVTLTSVLAIVLCFNAGCVRGEFEDARCRCVCPSAQHFAKPNVTVDERRRYYTKPINAADECNTQGVVRELVKDVVDESRLDAFLANCECKFESRNTVMIKVVVIFVICVVVVLVTYMCFLLCLDPMLKRQGRSGIRYEHHKDEDTDENIFNSPASNELQPTGSMASSSSDGQIRTRNAVGGSVLDRVEAQQNKWMRKVEEQRKNIFTDHTMLN